MSRLLLGGIILLAALIVLPAGALAQQPGSAATSPVPLLMGETTVPVTVVTNSITITAEVNPTVKASPGDGSLKSSVNEIEATFQGLSSGTLSDAEMQDIMYLQEAQKLQRDLYTVDAQQYPNAPVFANLQQTASSFMTADDFILAKYGITSSSAAAPGSFTSPQLQAEYNRLVSRGGLLTDSLGAAAQSEEIHISDLTGAMSRTDNPDLQYIYNQELALSRNNLRALASALSAAGGSYSPQYLTVDTYNAIIGSPMESIPSPLPPVPVTPVPTQPTPAVTQAAPVQTVTPVPTSTPVPMPTPTVTMAPSYMFESAPSVYTGIAASFQALPSGTLSDAEIADINYLQEAEKMQLDLYGALASQYSNAPVFAALQQNEQAFYTADDVVLQKYGLANPAQGTPGVYSDTQLQNLYNRLNSQGGLLTDSYAVAAQSEEIHIADISAALSRTNNSDLQYLYTQDLAISRNNLRSIIAALTAAGGAYAPQYLSTDAFNAIIGSPMETVPAPVATGQVTPIPTQAAPPVIAVPTAVPTVVVTPSPTITEPVPMPYAVPFPPRLYQITAAFQAIPSSGLTDTETSDIMYLQEAQKLERDLYIYLGQQSPGDPLFASLAQSAATLMNADDSILSRYNLTNPEQNAAGQFSNPQIQQLYQLYTGQAGGTVPNALLIAAQSEDQHIASLYAAIGHTTNADLKFIYSQQLAFASNNLRAISQQLGGYGQSYTPQYLSQDAYNAIVTTPIEAVPTQ